MDDYILTFGSNEIGKHGKGCALDALVNYGAKYGEGWGLHGRSFAIPTKDHNIRTLPLNIIEKYVTDFILFARSHPELIFKVTKIGTGLAGYKNKDIAPFFASSPKNCVFDEDWKYILGEEYRYFKYDER